MDFRVYYDALDFFAHRWTLEILTSLDERPKRYTDLQRSIDPHVHPKSFNDALRRLVEHGMVSHPSVGDGARYALTPKGRQTLPSILNFVEDLKWWGGTLDGDAAVRKSTE